MPKSKQLKKTVKEKEKKIPKWKQRKVYEVPDSMNALLQSIAIDRKVKQQVPIHRESCPRSTSATTSATISPVQKEAQLRKVKKDNPKIMPRKEYQEKCDWLFSTFPLCQICDKRKGNQVHHALYGHKQRDDRSIVSVCEPCHYDVHHGKDAPLRDREEMEDVGAENHKIWGNHCYPNLISPILLSESGY